MVDGAAHDLRGQAGQAGRSDRCPVSPVWIEKFQFRHPRRGRGYLRGSQDTCGVRSSAGRRTARPDLEKLVREAYPTADMLVPTYSNGWLSNLDPHDITSQVEGAIRDADDE